MTVAIRGSLNLLGLVGLLGSRFRGRWDRSRPAGRPAELQARFVVGPSPIGYRARASVGSLSAIFFIEKGHTPLLEFSPDRVTDGEVLVASRPFRLLYEGSYFDVGERPF